MDTSFDKELKQLLEQSKPEDLGYRLNRDKLWDSIEARKSKKLIPWRLWVTHAAAIAAGLIIGSYFLSVYTQDAAQQGPVQTKPMAARTVAAPRNNTTAQPGLAAATPLVPTVAAPATADNRGSVAQQTAGKPLPQEAFPETPVQPEIRPDPAVMPLAQPIIAQAAKPKTKVLHLMDMHNENTRLIRAEEAQPETRWAWILPDHNDNAGTESFSAQVSKHILHPKNN